MGIKRRLARLFDLKSGKTVLFPADHGVSEGLIAGLEDMPALLTKMSALNIQGVILHKGMAAAHIEALPVHMPAIVHLSAGTKHSLPAYNKTLVCSVNEALRLGADAVSIHVNIGNDLEDRMLADLGMVTDEAHQLGFPVLAMIYARGGQIVNEFDPTLISHCIRLGAELGADMVKVAYSGEPESFARAVKSCPVPVVLAGGPRQPDFNSFLDMLKQALQTGVGGLSLGRNIFQHEEPLMAMQTVLDLVHGEAKN